MSRASTWSIVAGTVLAATISLNAGGWAVITLDSLPDVVEAGKPVTLAYTVRQHGVTPVDGLTGSIEAVSGSSRVTARPNPGRSTGQYTAALTLPRTGDWTITVDSGFIDSRLTLLPLTAVDPSAHAPAPLTAAERGRRLFVAKGCVSCHRNDLGTPNRSTDIGPALVAGKYQSGFLGRILADPASTLPSTNQFVRMPNLQLQSQEIASLVAFINGDRIVAAR